MSDDFGGSSKIEKLNDSNFYVWKERIVHILALKDLDAFIEDLPTEDIGSAVWKKNDRKARAIIGLSLSDEHLEHVRDVKTAREMWNVILNVFERHTLLNKLSARRKFYTVTMQTGEKVLTYLNRVKQLAATLKSMNVEIDDQEIAMAALNGLPSSYESLIIALDALGNDEKVFTFDLVKSRLLQEEQRASERTYSPVNAKSSALVGIRGEDDRNPNGSSSTKRINKYANHRCENCGNLGHTVEKCWGKDVNGRRPPRPYSSGEKGRETSALVNEHQTGSKFMTEEDFVCLMSKIRQSNYPEGSSSWILDSGCTAHMTFDKSMFDTYESIADASVEMGTKCTTKVVGRGSITTKIQCGSSFEIRKLENVLHVPSFGYSLLSVSTMDKKGFRTTFGDKKCVVSKGSSILASGKLDGSLYVIHTESNSTLGSALVASLSTWHERMAHVDVRGIVQMADKGIVHGLRLLDKKKDTTCEGCAQGKAHRSTIPRQRLSQRANNLLDRVHSDVCGPIEVPSLGGSRYFVTFIDECSNWVTVFLLKRKSEVVKCYFEFESYAERQTGRKIRIIRSDRGGEYLNDSLEGHLKNRGIVHELTTAYTPHQNGIAERFNRTCMNLVRSMLHHRNVPKCFWAEALATAVYVRNRVTSSSLPSDITPYHLWHKDTPNVGHLRVFGCKCWYTLPLGSVRKLDIRGKPAVFVGYAEWCKAYKLIDQETGKVVISRDVVFDEKSTGEYKLIFDSVELDHSEMYKLSEEKIGVDIEEEAEIMNAEDSSGIAEPGQGAELSTADESQNAGDVEDADRFEVGTDVSTDPVADDLESDETGSAAAKVTRSGRVSKPPGSWWRAYSAHVQYSALISTATKPLPTSFKQAVNGPDSRFWLQGIKSELESLKKYKTWKVVPRSTAKDRKVLTTRWVFVEKQKIDENGNISLFPKARNVVRGFEQVQGVDYLETFAPVVKYTSVRTLCSIVAEQDLEMHLMDANTAFLNGIIEEDIFIEIPEGVEITEEDVKHLGLDNLNDIDSMDLVCKLEKSMYGTKQAPRCWNKKINSVLLDQLEFERSEADPCLYVKHDSKGIMVIAMYVDDMILVAKTRSQISWMKSMLCSNFEMKDLGEAKFCLGMEITRNRREKKLWLTQEGYMNKIMERFGMLECKPVATPMVEPKSPYERLEEISVQDEKAEGVPYREAVGSLMYLMICTRPDIAYAVGKVARFCESPKMKHWVAVKRILRYVKGTCNVGLRYEGMKVGSAFGYCDSDWAGDVSDRKSTSAYVFMMSGSAVSWCSKKQTIVATSSCEAEYVSMTMACKEAVWFNRLISSILTNYDASKPIEVFSDSQSAIKLGTNESINKRNKHIDISFHYVRDTISNGKVSFGYIATAHMVADMLTKPLERIKFEQLKHLCGLSVKGE